MRALKRITLTVLVTAALGAGAASPAVATAAPARTADGVEQQASAIRVAERWTYLGRYYDVRACVSAVDGVTRPYGPYDDAECRSVVDSDGSIAYWELWGVIY